RHGVVPPEFADRRGLARNEPLAHTGPGRLFQKGAGGGSGEARDLNGGGGRPNSRRSSKTKRGEPFGNARAEAPMEAPTQKRGPWVPAESHSQAGQAAAGPARSLARAGPGGD